MIAWIRANKTARTCLSPINARRCLSQAALDRLAQPVQSYISTSRDPFLNLSIEHFLLQKTAPGSVILLLYVNRPSIVLGRNQNPWLEVNLALLDPVPGGDLSTKLRGLGVVDLVRRRSGGGTVFHDEGNVNWTVISPSADFTRDKHAEMVVRALRSCGVDRARVNERHDIVLDQGTRHEDTDRGDTRTTPYIVNDASGPRPLKVSGSAYKLTRQRALHHGTCLLSSPNLDVIPDYLHSPAKPYMTARGVESVSSPVGNILLDNEKFMEAVQKQFALLYSHKRDTIDVGQDWLKHEAVRKGYEELQSPEWTYLQTPQFSISNTSDAAAQLSIELTVRNGTVTKGSLHRRDADGQQEHAIDLPSQFVDAKLHEISSWKEQLDSPTAGLSLAGLAAWLQHMLPTRLIRKHKGHSD